MKDNNRLLAYLLVKRWPHRKGIVKDTISVGGDYPDNLLVRTHGQNEYSVGKDSARLDYDSIKSVVSDFVSNYKTLKHKSW